MVISTAGTGERPLFVSYVSEVPIWKTTYRLVLREKGAPLLQGWAIIDNTIGEDWKGVELSLVAGAPQSFIQDVSQPYYGRRPTVSLPQAAQVTPQTHQAAIAAGYGLRCWRTLRPPPLLHPGDDGRGPAAPDGCRIAGSARRRRRRHFPMQRPRRRQRRIAAVSNRSAKAPRPPPPRRRRSVPSTASRSRSRCRRTSPRWCRFVSADHRRREGRVVEPPAGAAGGRCGGLADQQPAD